MGVRHSTFRGLSNGKYLELSGWMVWVQVAVVRKYGSGANLAGFFWGQIFAKSVSPKFRQNVKIIDRRSVSSDFEHWLGEGRKKIFFCIGAIEQPARAHT